MSSVNQFETINYSQPLDYRFSHDSVFLSRRVFELSLNFSNPVETALDLCAGCGIIGYDYLYHLDKNKLSLPKIFDFIEVQSNYREHLQENLTRIQNKINLTTQINFDISNYENLSQKETYRSRYDLILCNPPYFHLSQGKLSPSEFKNRCRFFIDSNLTELLSSIAHCLKPKGQAFVLIKKIQDHKINIQTDIELFKNSLDIIQIEKIRKTDLYKITRK